MADSPRQLFVYYRVAQVRLGDTVAAVRALQAALAAAHPGLRVALLRRPEAQDGQVTLMETYAGALDAAALDALDALTRAAGALPQPRHAEWFEPLP